MSDHWGDVPASVSADRCCCRCEHGGREGRAWQIPEVVVINQRLIYHDAPLPLLSGLVARRTSLVLGRLGLHLDSGLAVLRGCIARSEQQRVRQPVDRHGVGLAVVGHQSSPPAPSVTRQKAAGYFTCNPTRARTRIVMRSLVKSSAWLLVDSTRTPPLRKTFPP